MIKIQKMTTAYKTRANGWVQDSSDFEHLWSFCNAFSQGAPLFQNIKQAIKDHVKDEVLKSEFLTSMEHAEQGYTYSQIVGHHESGKSRKTSTTCNGIGQAAVKGQTRPYLADWPTDNFLRWAYLLGFLSYEMTKDIYKITSSGKTFANESDPEKRLNLIGNAVKMYPPARRIIRLLKEHPEGMTKFEIGESLGCIGEKGFTNIGQKLFEQLYSFGTDEEKKKLIENEEGSSDKYARQICSWLMKLKLVSSSRNSEDGKPPLLIYKLTPLGQEAARKLRIKNKINVLFPMLSMERKSERRMKRRALILYFVQEKGHKDINQIIADINSQGITTDVETVVDDVLSMFRCGIDVEVVNNEVILNDTIDNLKIPDRITVSPVTEVEETKNRLRPLLKHLDHDLLELIDFAYDGSKSSWFEHYTWKVYQSFCTAKLLGGPSRPDVIAQFDQIGIIIDSKAYPRGFSASRSLKDEMIRYVNEAITKPSELTVKWWENFTNTVSDFAFQYVSTKYSPEIKNQIYDISVHANGKKGSAITAANLLLLAETALSKKIDPNIFLKNDEIVADDFLTTA